MIVRHFEIFTMSKKHVVDYPYGNPVRRSPHVMR